MAHALSHNPQQNEDESENEDEDEIERVDEEEQDWEWSRLGFRRKAVGQSNGRLTGAGFWPAWASYVELQTDAHEIMPGVGGGSDGLAGSGGHASGWPDKYRTEAVGGHSDVRSGGGEHARANRGDNGKSRHVAIGTATYASHYERLDVWRLLCGLDGAYASIDESGISRRGPVDGTATRLETCEADL